MPSIIKVIGDEVDITTANTVNSANLVRIYATNEAVITISDAGSFTMPAGSVTFVEKNYTSTVAASNTAVACAVSYRA
jgi:hypothetical protein